MAGSPVIVRGLAWSGVGIGALGAAVGSVPAASFIAPFLLVFAVGLVAAAAWRQGVATPDESPSLVGEAKFHRDLVRNLATLALTVVFLLLTMVELLAIPAAFGHLEVFGEFALGFIGLFPVVIVVLLAALAGLVVVAEPGHGELPTRRGRHARIAAGLTGAALLASLAVGAGVLNSMGVRPERSVFVLAAALVTLFFYIRLWNRLPSYDEVSEWLEREQRLQSSGLLRGLVFGFAGLAGFGLLGPVLAAVGVLPQPLAIVGAGVAMLALLGATFSVGVSHVVPHLEVGIENAEERRKIRRVILNTTSLVLTGVSLAVGTLTVLAFLAQVAGVEVFRFLLEALVAQYPLIVAVALLPLVGAVIVRTRVKTEIRYTDRLKALAMGMATLTIVLVFLGVFVGAGFAQGTGILIENAVLILGAAVLALTQFVKARALLPGVFGLLRDAVKTSAEADETTQESIRKRMMITYVVGLVFVLAFAGYVTSTSLGVVDAPGSSLGTDVVFFIYVLVGLALLAMVGLRYFQSVNIDPRWAKKPDIGTKRLTSAQVTKYLVLGFSIGFAALLALIGVLVQTERITAMGPFELGKKFSTDFFVFALLIGLGPYGWYQSREGARIEAINAKFPEFLRDLAESQRSGMTLTEAVITASKGNYGVLTGEIRKMASQIEWGVSFTESLERFGRRANTQLIQRTVSLVVQASNAGGNVVDVLTAAADDAREIQQILRERKQSMSIYVMIIYIAFAVFLGVIAVLNAQFIPEVAKAVSKADGVSIGGLNFRAFDEQEFKTIFFHAAVIQGFGGGLVAGVMAGGRPINGLRHSFILVLIGWVLFRLVIG